MSRHASREMTATEWDALERGRDRAQRHRMRPGPKARWGIRHPDGTVTAAIYTDPDSAAYWLAYEQERRPELTDATVVQVIDDHGRTVTP